MIFHLSYSLAPALLYSIVQTVTLWSGLGHNEGGCREIQWLYFACHAGLLCSGWLAFCKLERDRSHGRCPRHVQWMPGAAQVRKG